MGISMLPSLPTLRSGLADDYLLIMKIITSVGLAILLLVGFAASSTHTKAEGPLGVTAAASAMHDPYTESVAPIATEGSALGFGTVVSSVGDDALLAAGLCLLGLLCGLVLVLLIRAILRRRPLPDPLSRPLIAKSLLVSTPRPNASTLTLTQLGLSRT